MFDDLLARGLYLALSFALVYTNVHYQIHKNKSAAFLRLKYAVPNNLCTNYT